MAMKITTILATVAIVVAVGAVGPGAVIANAQVPGVIPQQSGSRSGGGGEQQQSDTVTIQKTAESTVDPLPGHSAHQLVMALPPRNDGKLWVGTVTWTASKPVEVVVLHPYNKPQTVNQTVGEPLNAPNPFAPGKNIAITLMTRQTDRPIFSGSLPFAGTALAFHTTTGQPFRVTYTLDAVAKSPTTLPPTTTK